MTSNTFITDTTVLRPQRFAGHALNTKGLSIQSTLGSQIFDDLFAVVGNKDLQIVDPHTH
jgi:hypothetical protein